MKTIALPCLLTLAALLPLAGCTEHAPAGAAKPAATAAQPAQTSASLPPAVGAAATVSEADSGRTLHLDLGETVAIRLAVNESTGNRWFLANPLVGGILAKKGDAVYTKTPAGTVATVLYRGLHAGSQELHFSYAPPDARQNVARTADFRVIVK